MLELVNEEKIIMITNTRAIEPLIHRESINPHGQINHNTNPPRDLFNWLHGH